MVEHVWYYIRDGLLGTTEQVGPIAESELLSLARQAKLNRETLVSSPTRTTGAWHPAQQITGLLKALELGEQERQAELERQNAERVAERQAKQELRRREDENRHQERVLVTAQAEQQRQQAEIVRRTTFYPRQYPALQVIIAILYVLATLAACNFLLHLFFVVMGFQATASAELGDPDVAVAGGLSVMFLIAVLLVSFILHSILVISLVGGAEIIRVLVDVQQNTQLTAFCTDLASQERRRS